ncbi:MAG: CD1871A family CXXC motif-containing protein [Candidatus Fermentibacteria bacterium]|nr:CD1871A family CXXC motif-containing protein [Candidatus Fermentibacteria bacterium]
MVVASTSLRIILFIAAFLLVVAGYVFGDPAAILSKATNICLECIGIG